MHGSRDEDSWERVFTPGSRLWRGLTSINEYIEHYGTGGGLSRPLFAEFLVEADDALGTEPLTTSADAMPSSVASGVRWLTRRSRTKRPRCARRRSC